MSFEERALHHLYKSVEINPEFGEAQIALAEHYYNKNNIRKLTEHLDSCFANGLNLSRLWYLKALVKLEQNEIQEAEYSISKALKYSTDNTDILELALRIYNTTENSLLKASVLEKLIASPADKPEYYSQLAEVKYRRGLIEDAKKDYELAVEFQEEDEHLLIKAAKFFFLCRREFKKQSLSRTFSYIRSLLSKVLLLNPHNRRAQLLLAEIEYGEENFPKAYQLLERCFHDCENPEKYITKFYELGVKFDGQKKGNEIIKLGLQNLSTRGVSFHLLISEKNSPPCSQTLEFCLKAIFHLSRNLRSKIKTYHKLKNNSDFYLARHVLSEIDTLSLKISDAYLLYYQYSLHKRGNIKSKALEKYKVFKFRVS